jgi:predicted alpha/beta superfamily hydrolase
MADAYTKTTVDAEIIIKIEEWIVPINRQVSVMIGDSLGGNIEIYYSFL